MRLFVSMNFCGTFTTTNVRASHIAAASRWSANYLEVTAPLPGIPVVDVFRQKLTLPRYLPQDAEMVLIDGDAIVSCECENPFDLYDNTSVGGVANMQDGQPGDVDACQREAWESVEYLLCQKINYAPDNYLNGGFLIGRVPLLSSVFSLALSLSDSAMPKCVIDGMTEQTVLNMALGLFGRYSIFPQDYNRICPELWEGNRPMRHYIEHFARIASLRDGRDEILSTIKWQEPLQVPEPLIAG